MIRRRDRSAEILPLLDERPLSVSAIAAALGLRPGTGGLWRHIKSMEKRGMVECVEAETGRAGRQPLLVQRRRPIVAGVDLAAERAACLERRARRDAERAAL